MRLVPLLFALVCAGSPPARSASVPAVPPLIPPSASGSPASPAVACGGARNVGDARDLYDTGRQRVVASKDPCAVADNNLAREEAAILRGRPLTAAAPRKVWDAKSKPQFLTLIAKRFQLEPPELATLDRVGFAVPGRLEVSSYAQGYHEIFQSQLPVYITADSIFHAIFASHDSAIQRLERTQLLPMLAQALNSMHCALGAAAAAYPPDVARDLDLYLLVARRLMAGADKPRSAFADRALEAEADALVARVTAASDVDVVTLFGRPRLVDFTQYGPRGHYAVDEPMQRYFRAAMWASRLEFNLISRSSRSSAPGSRPDPRETPREAIAALALADLATRSGAAEQVATLDAAWAVLAGRREDVSMAQLAALRASVGPLTNPHAFEKLKGAIGDRFPRTTRLHPMPEGTRELPAIATLIGPRIVADSRALMPLVNGAVPGRHRVGIADVAYVLGFDRAKSYLAKDLAAFPQLDAQLEVARTMAARPTAGEDDLYGAWLAAVRALARTPQAASKDGMLPSYLTGEAGRDLRLGSIAAAYGQLKHANVLMAGQPYAEFGCEIPDGYVEPVPAAYDALIDYAGRGARLALRLDPEDSVGVRAHFERLGRVLRVLRAIVGDEIAGRPLSAAQRRWLGMVAELNVDRSVETTGHPPTYTGWYFDLFLDRQEDGMRGADFIADYFTSQEGVAYVGATAPRLGIFVVDAGGPPRAFVGPVAHPYEFFGPAGQRTTDVTAKTQEKRDERWALAYTIPAAAPPPGSLQLKYEAEAGQLVLTADRALGAATIKALDHHRFATETKHATVGVGETRVALENKRIGGIFIKLGDFSAFVVADAYGEIQGRWGAPAEQ